MKTKLSNSSRVMEADAISKNGAIPKSLITSRGNMMQRTIFAFCVFCACVTSAFARQDKFPSGLIQTEDLEPPPLISGNLITDMKIYSPGLYKKYRSGDRLIFTSTMFTLVGLVGITGSVIQNSPDWGWFDSIGALGLAGMFVSGYYGFKKQNEAIIEFYGILNSSQSAKSHFQLNVYPNRVGVAFVF